METFPQDFFLEHVIDEKGDGPIDGPNDRVQKQWAALWSFKSLITKWMGHHHGYNLIQPDPTWDVGPLRNDQQTSDDDRDDELATGEVDDIWWQTVNFMMEDT